MEPILIPIISSICGGLVTATLFALKVLPEKVTRREVEEMLDRQPLHTDMRHLRSLTDGNARELAGIREELVGLRTDVTRLTATLEAVLKGL